MDDLLANIGALVPSIGVLALFAVVVRAIIVADRRERANRLRQDAQLRQESDQ